MDDTSRAIRKFVFDRFLERAHAPSAPEIATEMGLDLDRTRRSLQTLDAEHHLKLLEGTFRILMAFPFSDLATPYIVTRGNGSRYFANCAWDAIAFHAMLGEAVRIDSFCDACGKGLRFGLSGGGPAPDFEPLPVVELRLPAADWWKDITRTCANTMVFLGAEEAATDPAGLPKPRPPGRVTIDQVCQMSIPIYARKMRADYDRPPPTTIQATFDRLGLTGSHWKLIPTV